MNKFILILAFTLNSILIFSQEKSNLFDVARQGTLQEIEAIYKQNPQLITTVNKDGFSALVLSTYRNNNAVARFLIEHGANVNENSKMGSPLMAAVVKGNNEIAALLIQKKANVNTTDEKGTTALIYAVQFGNAAIIKELLLNKADKTIKDNQGKTAFEYAVFSGNNEIINQLKQ